MSWNWSYRRLEITMCKSREQEWRTRNGGVHREFKASLDHLRLCHTQTNSENSNRAFRLEALARVNLRSDRAICPHCAES